MSKPKFTPGPWFSVTRLSGSENHHGFKICGNDGWALAEVMPVDEDGIEGKANAHLIAAAPELYEALETCLLYGAMTGDDWAIFKAETALAKARGEG